MGMTIECHNYILIDNNNNTRKVIEIWGGDSSVGRASDVKKSEAILGTRKTS